MTGSPASAATESPGSLILWNVVEEHFEEAEFLFGQWERALKSPKYTLTELSATLERRLEAHLDALLVGGREVAQRILDPQLENADEPDKALVAALTLLFDGDEGTAARLLDLLERSEGPLQTALSRAFVLANLPHLDGLLLARIRKSRLEPQEAVLLEVLTRRGVNAGDLLYGCISSGDSRLVAAALEAAARFGRRDMLAAAEKYLHSEDPALQAKALHAGLVLQSRAAWYFCLDMAERAKSANPDLLLLVAMLGRPADQEILYRRLDDPVHLERNLWNLGFCGTVEAGDRCLSFLQSHRGRIAKIAAESLAWIGGLDVNDQRLHGPVEEPREEETLPPLEQDDLDSDLTPDGVDDLPVPNREAFARWWGQNRSRLADNGRNLLGRPFSADAVVHALRSGPLWRCGAVARELSIRTGGAAYVSSGVFSSRRRREIDRLVGIELSHVWVS